MGLGTSISEYSQNQLFIDRDYHDPERLKERLPFVETNLPFLEGLSNVTPPEFKIWFEDGISIAINDHMDLLKSLTSISNEESITEELLRRQFDAFVDQEMWGKARSLAWAARKHSGNEEIWTYKEHQADLGFTYRGLQEAHLLPFRIESEDTSPITPMKSKHFLKIYQHVMIAAEEIPQEMEQYLALADELYLELINSFDDYGRFNHETFMRFGYGLNDPRKAAIFDRLKNRDEEWRQRTAKLFRSRINEELKLPHYGRSDTLFEVARYADLIPADELKTIFIKKYHQLDLSIELPNYLTQTNSMFVSLYHTSTLLSLKHIASQLYQADIQLANELEQVMVRRELEVAQALGTKPDGLSNYELSLIQDEIGKLAEQLPDDDPQKKQLLLDKLNREMSDFTDNPGAYMGSNIDSLVQQNIDCANGGVIDLDSFAINLEQIEMSAIERLQNKFDADTVEILMGFISPLCRISEDVVEKWVSKDAKSKIIGAFESGISNSKKDDIEFYNKLKECLNRGFYPLFKEYWEKCEEYFG